MWAGRGIDIIWLMLLAAHRAAVAAALGTAAGVGSMCSTPMCIDMLQQHRASRTRA